MLNITFDSNVFPGVVNPDKHLNEPSISSFRIINLSIKNEHIKGFLPETSFTLDAIQKVDRHEFFKTFRPDFIFREPVQGNSMELSISIYPDTTSHPGNNQYLDADLNDALQLGFKILPCIRIGWFKNPDLRNDWFVNFTETSILSNYQEIAGEVMSKIEDNLCGIYHLKKIAEKHKRGTEHWIDILKKVPESEEKAMIKAFAECGDGDAIAFHIASGNDYFCTRDQGKNAGQSSVMSTKNRNWLERDYGIKFISPEDLAAILTT
jgi:hypothetical protein